MILGASLLRFLVSAGGVTLVLVLIACWTIARPRDRRPRLALVSAAVIYGLLACSPLAESGVRWLAAPFRELTRDDVPVGRIAIVLLGSGSRTFTNWRGLTYSIQDREGMARTFEAARAFRLADAEWVISSGGKPDPDDPNFPAGVTMRDTLMRMGIPGEQIVVDQQSRTTREQALLVADTLRRLGAEHVVLVTSGFHMRRSLAVFRSAGVDAIPAIARGDRQTRHSLRAFVPSNEGLQLSHQVLHEFAGLLYYRLRGWTA